MRATVLFALGMVLVPCVARAQPRSADPDVAAREAFERALAVDRFESFALDPGARADLDSYTVAVAASIERRSSGP